MPMVDSAEGLRGWGGRATRGRAEAGVVVLRDRERRGCGGSVEGGGRQRDLGEGSGRKQASRYLY
jgi:hypothetical protein